MTLNKKIENENEKLTNTIKEKKQKISNQIKIPTKYSSIRKDNNYILFKELDISMLDEKNERAKGIKNLAFEIKKLSQNAGYKIYPISYCFLIRALLEQTSIYFLIKKGKWESLKAENNNREVGLDMILKKITRDKQNLINDDTTRKIWDVCFNNNATKNQLDLIIHHPYKVIADIGIIQTITNAGVFSIIQFFVKVK